MNRFLLLQLLLRKHISLKRNFHVLDDLDASPLITVPSPRTMCIDIHATSSRSPPFWCWTKILEKWSSSGERTCKSLMFLPSFFIHYCRANFQHPLATLVSIASWKTSSLMIKYLDDNSLSTGCRLSSVKQTPNDANIFWAVFLEARQTKIFSARRNTVLDILRKHLEDVRRYKFFYLFYFQSRH